MQGRYAWWGERQHPAKVARTEAEGLPEGEVPLVEGTQLDRG